MDSAVAKDATATRGGAWVVERSDLDRLFDALRNRGYTVIAPRVRDGAIVLEEARTSADLPAGWSDDLEAGRYRLVPGQGQALFAWTVGPDSAKTLLHPPEARLLRVTRNGGGVTVEGGAPEPKLAFFGLHACDLAAVARQDRVLLGSGYADPIYARRREPAFFVAVQCTRMGPTCFCDSMGTGPRVTAGHDLALTEVVEDGRHVFVVEAGSPRGAEVLSALPARPADEADAQLPDRAASLARASRHRALPDGDRVAGLAAAHSHPRWDRVADRCLACGNCTMVCPTCFCTTIEDLQDLTAHTADRIRRWDSCFTPEFSYIHGGSVRRTIRARYRHWLTHKLSTWHEQFGASGCVGCGRCIVWCPAAIDITEEAGALLAPGPETGVSHGDA